MVRPGRILTTAASTLLCLVVSAQGLPASSWQQEARTAEQLVELAQEWIGGKALIAQVTALEVVGTETTRRVLFPDKLQILSPAGGVLSSFDGRVRWADPPPARPSDDGRAAGMLANRPKPTPEEVRQTGLEQVQDYALKYFVKSLPGLKMSVRRLDDGACAKLPGACLEFSLEGAKARRFIAMDAATGQPLAFVAEVIGNSGTAQTAEVFDDYRSVAGLRLPFKVTGRFVLPNGRINTESPFTLTAIKINPPLRASDFSPR